MKLPEVKFKSSFKPLTPGWRHLLIDLSALAPGKWQRLPNVMVAKFVSGGELRQLKVFAPVKLFTVHSMVEAEASETPEGRKFMLAVKEFAKKRFNKSPDIHNKVEGGLVLLFQVTLDNNELEGVETGPSR